MFSNTGAQGVCVCGGGVGRGGGEGGVRVLQVA